MGWIPEWFQSEQKKPALPKNAVNNLDDNLLDFLEKESPVKYRPTPPPQPSSTQSPNPPPDPSNKPLVPKEAIYQDGRYAHLWKNYRPQAELEAEAKSDQEKLADVFAAYRERKAEIGRAALENCAFENAAVEHCYQYGSYADIMVLCRTEQRTFSKCYDMQARFLKALGYLSAFERPPEEDERIQMHADTLFHRMLDQERQIEEAKKKKEPIPTFPPILEVKKDKMPKGFRDATRRAAQRAEKAAEAERAASMPMTPAERNKALAAAAKKAKQDKELPPLHPDVEDRLKPSAALGLRRRMKDMSPLEREIEERSAISEIEHAATSGQMIYDINEEARQKKREAGKGRGEWGDFVVKWFGGGPGAR